MSVKREEVIARGRHATVDALLDFYHISASKADLRGYFGCMDRQGRFLGTDATENWNAIEFYEFCLPYFSKGSGWTYTPLPQTRKVTYYPGPGATGAQFCTFDELLHNDGFGTCRGSGTLIYNAEQSSWFVAAYHLSFPVPNDNARAVTDLIKKGDPLLKAKEADAAAAKLLAELEEEEDGAKKATGGKALKKKKGKQ